MSKVELVTLKDAVMALLKMCKEGYTGAMYLYTDQGHGGIISVNTGDIIDIFFRNYRGTAALDALKQVGQVKFFFKDGSKGKALPDESLDNEIVFKELGIDSSAALSAGLKTILVVEDSGLARKILVEFLSDQGYYVIEAKDGEEASQQ